MQALEEEVRVLRERRSLVQLRKEDEERQSTRSVSMTRPGNRLAWHWGSTQIKKVRLVRKEKP